MSGEYSKLVAPFAVLGIRTEDDFLTGIEFLPRGTVACPPQRELAREVCRQLRAYCQNSRFVFDLPLRLAGSAFQKKIWQALLQIPAGKTVSYGQIAQQLHSAPRAVGQACAANPLPIVVPCHRVLAKQGLGGFMHAASGDPLAIKRWLLQHEGN